MKELKEQCHHFVHLNEWKEEKTDDRSVFALTMDEKSAVHFLINGKLELISGALSVVLRNNEEIRKIIDDAYIELVAGQDEK